MPKETVIRIALLVLWLLPGVAAAGGKVFAAAEGTDNVVVLDAATNTVLTTIGTGASSMPHNPIRSPDRKYVYVTLKGTGEVAKIDVNTYAVTRFSTGSGTPNPVHLDVSGDGNWLYVVNQLDDTVVKMSTADGSIVASYTFTPTINFKPHDVNIGPDGKLWVTDEYANTVTVLEGDLSGVFTPSTGSGTIAVGSRPIQVAFSVDGATAYVTNFNDNTVSVIDVANYGPGSPASFDMGGGGAMGPMGVVADPDGSRLWLTGTQGNTVHAHSLLPGDNYSYIEVNGLIAAHGLDIDDAGDYLYTTVKASATSAGRDAIAIIDTNTLAVTTVSTTGLAGLADAEDLHGVVYVSAVPLPAAAWLFLSGLAGLLWAGGTRKKPAA